MTPIHRSADGPDATNVEACPRCGDEAVRIAYGLPTGRTFAAAERGEIVLGGCLITGQDPDRAYLSCHHHWRSSTTDR